MKLYHAKHYTYKHTQKGKPSRVVYIFVFKYTNIIDLWEKIRGKHTIYVSSKW